MGSLNGIYRRDKYPFTENKQNQLLPKMIKMISCRTKHLKGNSISFKIKIFLLLRWRVIYCSRKRTTSCPKYHFPPITDRIFFKCDGNHLRDSTSSFSMRELYAENHVKYTRNAHVKLMVIIVKNISNQPVGLKRDIENIGWLWIVIMVIN